MKPVRAIGVSNFNIRQMQLIIEHAIVMPHNLQV
jgi:diketogulonate reductase-like aldo/keto reductase